MNIIARLRHFVFGLRPVSGSPPELRTSPLVRVSAHNRGLALLNIQSGKVFLCNRTGSNIWRGLEEGRQPEDVACQLSRQFAIDFDLARQDTFLFVDELERRGLITRTSASRWAAS